MQTGILAFEAACQYIMSCFINFVMSNSFFRLYCVSLCYIIVYYIVISRVLLLYIIFHYIMPYCTRAWKSAFETWHGRSQAELRQQIQARAIPALPNVLLSKIEILQDLLYAYICIILPERDLIYVYLHYTSRIPILLAYEVYIRSCRFSSINSSTSVKGLVVSVRSYPMCLKGLLAHFFVQGCGLWPQGRGILRFESDELREQRSRSVRLPNLISHTATMVSAVLLSQTPT